MLKEYLSKERVEKRGYFNYGYINWLMNNRKNNPFLFDRQLFALLSLEIWHSLFVDKNLYG
jgi:transposase